MLVTFLKYYLFTGGSLEHFLVGHIVISLESHDRTNNFFIMFAFLVQFDKNIMLSYFKPFNDASACVTLERCGRG